MRKVPPLMLDGGSGSVVFPINSVQQLEGTGSRTPTSTTLLLMCVFV